MKTLHRHKIQQKLFPAMGTLNSIVLPEEAGTDILDHAADQMLRLHKLWNIFDPESELSRVNASAGKYPICVSPETMRILQQAVHYSALSESAFDITAGALSSSWKTSIRESRLPGQDQLREQQRITGWNLIRIDPARQTVFLTKQGMRLDLGGIAKGYAADCICNYLLSCGVRNARINLGGTIRLIGESRKIGIRNPFQSGSACIGELTVSDQAIVTSGSYEQCAVIGGIPAHHIIDPRTGYPADSGLVSVTLTGQRASELDALATGILVLGAEHGAELLQNRNISAIFITDRGKILATQDLKTNFSVLTDCIA